MSPAFAGCFVCGDRNPRGLHVRFSTEGEWVRARFTADKSLLGYEHAVHGGIISALLDEALIWAVHSKTGRFGVTAELNVRFLKPLRVVTVCFVEGRVVEIKKRLCVAESWVIDAEGKPYARGSGKVL